MKTVFEQLNVTPDQIEEVANPIPATYL